MKPPRIALFNLLLAAFCIPVAILNAEISEDELGCFSRPADEQGKGFVAERAKGVVGEIAKTGTFKKWKTFEDDKVQFSYPDHDAITVEVKRDESVPVDGDRVSDVDTSFSRAYRIAADGETLLVLMLREADWLDDGVCFCGAVVYDRYLVRNGNLYRFSFLENGILKKMQVLGDDERIMMFEWTHLPIHPAVYRQIARSLVLKKRGAWTEADCRKRVLERYGAEGVVGWFDEGSTVESVEKVLGKPTRTKSDGVHVWEYPKTEDGYRWTERLSLPFSDGKLLRFGSGFYDSAWNDREAIKGGIPWMMQAAEPYEDPPVRGEQAKKMPERLKEELLAMFLEKAQDKDTDFNSLCQVLKILVEQGVQDEKALNIVRKRFVSDGDHYAAWVLHEAGHPEDVTLFIDKISKLYREAKGSPERDFGLSDLHNWLAFIPDDDERYPELLREGLRSPHTDVRDDAYFFLDSAPFPEKERIAFIHAGLEDASARVRYWSTRCFDKKNTTNLDWDILRKAAAQERDESTLKEMKEVLDKHGAAKGVPARQKPKAEQDGGGQPATRPESK
jgi:hypothetical protein